MASTKRRRHSFFAVTAVALAAGAGTFTFTPRAEAQEIQLTGPLAGAPAVRKLRLYRRGRFEVAPTVSFTLLDEYRRTILTGGRIQYNFTDWLAVGVWGAYGAASLTTNLTDQIDNTQNGGGAPRNVETWTNVNHTGTNPNSVGYAPFADQTAKMQWVAAPQLQFTPFRGKLAIFQKLFVDTDAYVHGGLAFIGIQEREQCGGGGQASCSDPASFALASSTKLAPTFGIGLNFYLSGFISLGAEYRAMPFAWNRAGFDTRGSGNDNKFPDGKIDSQDDTFKFNQMITIAVGFSFPTAPRISE